MRHIIAFLVATSGLFTAGPTAHAAAPDPRLRGTYSSFCYHEEAGDLLGIELSFVYPYGDDAPIVLYQHAQGEPPPPQLLALTREKDGRLRFAGNTDIPPFFVEFLPGDKLRVRPLQESTPEEA